MEAFDYLSKIAEALADGRTLDFINRSIEFGTKYLEFVAAVRLHKDGKKEKAAEDDD